MWLALLPYEYVCINGHVFQDYDLSDFAYGEFILRNNSSEVRYLNSFEDVTFDEICHLVKSNQHISIDKNVDESDMIHFVYSITCDRSTDNSPFRIDQLPKCPICKEDVDDWGDLPLGPEDVEILPVTHYQWNKLTQEERAVKINEAIEEFLQKEKGQG